MLPESRVELIRALNTAGLAAHALAGTRPRSETSVLEAVVTIRLGGPAETALTDKIADALRKWASIVFPAGSPRFEHLGLIYGPDDAVVGRVELP